MIRKAISGIMLTLTLIGVTLIFSVRPAMASGTIYIRADGSIDPAGSPISTIDNVTYTLTGDVDRSIVVERDNIVIDGAGYIVQGTGFRLDVDSRGIDLTGRSNVRIVDVGIRAFREGIYLWNSVNNNLSMNIITNSYFGILLGGSSNNSISGNIIRLSTQPTPDNVASGICILFSSNYNTVSGNTVENTFEGVGIQSSSNYNSVSGNNITGNYYGIGVSVSSSENIVSGNTVASGRSGIALERCSNNIVSGNNVTENYGFSGIKLYPGASNNVLNNNRIVDNYRGITLWEASYNSIYHNSFIDNIQQVLIITSGYVNFWDNGYPSGGNYWSDYTARYPSAQELDASGIWDTPYNIDENNQDNYPLMELWTPTPSTPTEVLEELIETIEVWNLPKGTENSLTSKLEQALHAWDKGNENVASHKLMSFVNHVEALRDKKLTEDQAHFLISNVQRIIDLINE